MSRCVAFVLTISVRPAPERRGSQALDYSLGVRLLYRGGRNGGGGGRAAVAENGCSVNQAFIASTLCTGRGGTAEGAGGPPRLGTGGPLNSPFARVPRADGRDRWQRRRVAGG